MVLFGKLTFFAVPFTAEIILPHNTLGSNSRRLFSLTFGDGASEFGVSAGFFRVATGTGIVLILEMKVDFFHGFSYTIAEYDGSTSIGSAVPFDFSCYQNFIQTLGFELI